MNNKDLNNTSHTDWSALEAMSDEDIDYSDIPPLTEDFFKKAVLQIPASRAKNLIQIDPDILKWFESQSEEYQDLINKVLRCHIEQSSKSE